MVYIAPPTSRPRAHHKTNEHAPWSPNTDSNEKSKIFLVFYKMSLLTTAPSGLSAACWLHVLLLSKAAVWRLTRSQHNKARSADRAGISVTGVSKSEMYSGICPRSDLWTSKQSLNWILSWTGNLCSVQLTNPTYPPLHIFSPALVSRILHAATPAFLCYLLHAFYQMHLLYRVLSLDISISISNCILEYKMRA